MYLNSEEKTVGKQNFFAAIGNSLIRREFLQEGARRGIISGRGLGAYYFGYDQTVKSPLRVGVIGTGDEGNVLIGAITPEFLQVKAIADIRPYNIHRAFHGDHYSEAALKARPGLLDKYGWGTENEARKRINVYGDYHEMLENEKDLEAVIIALPLHLHAPAAIAAMKAGLHVLTEKLMAHSVRECKEMARISEQTGRLLATGHQRHYNILYDNAVQAINSGLLGDIHYIRAQWHRGNMPGKDSWQPPMPQSIKPDDSLAKQLNTELQQWREKLKSSERKNDDTEEIERWRKRLAQKEAQIADELIKDKTTEYGYQPIEITANNSVVYHGPPEEELIRWRLWERTGGGLMAELGSHQLDAASIFISAMHGGKKQYPLNVVAAANRPIFPADRDVDDHVYCTFEFPAPDYSPDDPLGRRKTISVAYASINGNGFGSYGETVFGTGGTLVLERETEAMLYKTSATGDTVKVFSDTGQDGRTARIEVDEDGRGDPLSSAIGQQALSEVTRGYTEQLEHWAWCIRNLDPENQPRCHPKVALADAVIALTTNIAAREGRRIEFKEEWFDPQSDETPDGQST